MIASYLRSSVVLVMTLTLAILAGCGEGDEGATAPGVAMTASSVGSTTVNGHTHSVSMPFSDLGAAATVNYRSSQTSGHTHVIALSAQQLGDLYTGKQVKVTSTPAADGHLHEWVFQGGTLVYESMCFNCHSNSKRGTAGMSGRPPLPSQVSALMNPSGQPFSTAPAAVPDPNFNPSTPLPPIGNDGAALYAANCASPVCHGPLTTSTKRGKTAAEIKAGIASVPVMKGISLTDTQIQAIADALK
jgi:mono/diheme cytochrome c family protein